MPEQIELMELGLVRICLQPRK